MRTRLLAGAASAGLLTLGLAVPAHADTPAYDTAPLQAASTWLVGSLQSNLLPSSYGPNYGGSADAAMSLQAVGDHADATTIASAVAAGIDDYISGDAYGDTGSTYAGAVAKAAVMLQETGGDPTQVGTNGDEDLITRLEGQVQSSGRIQDTSQYGDYETTLGQAYAARALTTAGSDDATAATDGEAATDFLLTQQCSSGWFRLYFDSTGPSDDPVGTDESCDADSSSGPSVDATATAILELEPQVAGNAAVARSVGRAESWLISVQASNGSFTDGTSTGEANTNSTGLAGWALGEMGHTVAAEDAASWVRTQQLANAGTCTPVASGSVGAIAHDTDAWDTGASGVTTQSDSFWLPTAQALPVLQFVPAATPDLAITGPTGYVKAGSTATYHVSGAVAGEPVCVTGGKAGVLARTGATSGTGSAVITEHAYTATRSITVTDGTASASTTTKVLGAATLHVSLAHAKLARKALEHVTVTGLAAKESVSIHWRGKVVAHGSAGPGGTYKGSFHVGTKKGKRTVSADGQFSNRSGTAHLTVK